VDFEVIFGTLRAPKSVIIGLRSVIYLLNTRKARKGFLSNISGHTVSAASREQENRKGKRSIITIIVIKVPYNVDVISRACLLKVEPDFLSRFSRFFVEKTIVQENVYN